MNDSLIFDTSVWIDFLNAKFTDKVLLLKKHITFNYTIYLTPVILQEILQGIKEDRLFKKVKEQLLRFPILDINARYAAIGSASLYRKLKKMGVTIRKSNDCIIAFFMPYILI